MIPLATALGQAVRGGRGEALARWGVGGGEGEGASGLPKVPDPDARAFLSGVAACSAYLGGLLRRASPDLLSAPLEESWATVLDRARTASPVPASLRRAKADGALLVALADLSGLWPMEVATERLSDLADICAERALRAAWEEVARGREAYGLPFDGTVPGLAVIAMGKLGTRTLNYSSDIDLILAYDAERLPEGAREAPREATGRVVRAFLRLLSERTPDGYVFRTDLRLRPDPSSSAPAVGLAQAERYYEQYGQNWERAAHIKARVSAGDKAAGEAYLSLLRPFVWRRTIDWEALADVKAMSRQIHAKVGSPEIAARGADVKLGPGGIRECEFFAEVQQIILGGREAALRVPGTLGALDALAAGGHVEKETADALAASYRLLRDVEHRLQMREDLPDRVVPTDEPGLSRLAALMGMTGPRDLEAAILGAMRCVHDAYAELTEAPDEPLPGSLVFTGVEDDPRTLETLRRLGFVRPEAVTKAVRGWHQGSLPATRSVRARELLTALVPRLLMAASETGEPDEAFEATGRFLGLLPAGQGLFSLFTLHPGVLDDVVALCAASPDLALRMGRRPALVEALLARGARRAAPGVGPGPIEEAMDAVRRWVGGERLRAAADLTLGRADPYEAGARLSVTAQQAVALLDEAVARETAGPPLAVLAFGRFGAGAMTVSSDLDLVFVYEGGPDDAERALRRVRRLVAALSAPTAEGRLYEVDMKLRPSGGAGPAAVTLGAFERYYEEKAWVWELMALTKARVVAGDPALGARVEAVVMRALARPRQAGEVAAAAADMRARLTAEHPPRGPLDVKRLPGGLTDIDFAAQVLSLTAGEERRPPRAAPDALRFHEAAGRLPPNQASALIGAHRVHETVAQYARATFGLAPAGPLPVFRAARLSRLLGRDDPEAAVAEAAEAVRSASAAVLAAL